MKSFHFTNPSALTGLLKFILKKVTVTYINLFYKLLKWILFFCFYLVKSTLLDYGIGRIPYNQSLASKLLM